MLPSQAKQFIELILGCKPLPDPDVDADGFLTAVGAALKTAPPTFDPSRPGRKEWR